MEYQVLLQRLKKVRKSKGISQRKMAEELGVSAQQVSLLERGVAVLKMEDYLSMCKILKISPKELMNGEVSQEEYHNVAEKLWGLSERDFRIVKDLIILMGLSIEDL